MLKALLFGLDGTLTDTNSVHRLTRVAHGVSCLPEAQCLCTLLSGTTFSGTTPRSRR